jgi:hypothetical protein
MQLLKSRVNETENNYKTHCLTIEQYQAGPNGQDFEFLKASGNGYSQLSNIFIVVLLHATCAIWVVYWNGWWSGILDEVQKAWPVEWANSRASLVR